MKNTVSLLLTLTVMLHPFLPTYLNNTSYQNILSKYLILKSCHSSTSSVTFVPIFCKVLLVLKSCEEVQNDKSLIYLVIFINIYIVVLLFPQVFPIKKILLIVYTIYIQHVIIRRIINISLFWILCLLVRFGSMCTISFLCSKFYNENNCRELIVCCQCTAATVSSIQSR